MLQTAIPNFSFAALIEREDDAEQADRPDDGLDLIRDLRRHVDPAAEADQQQT